MISVSKALHFDKSKLSASFGETFPETPFYFYSEALLDELWTHFRASLKTAVLPVENRFPLKANNNPHVLKFFKARGSGADVVSGGELRLALSSGFLPEEIIFSGVGKSDRELGLAVEHNIGIVAIESRSEMLRLNKIAESRDQKIAVAFRVNPNVDAKTHPYISTGLHEHKFGLECSEALEMYKISRKLKGIEVKALSMHIGSQIRDLEVFDEAAEEVLEFSKSLKELGAKLETLDLGGGLGIDYSTPFQSADFERYGEVFKKAADSWARLWGKENTQLLTECGRALVAQSGFILTKVIATKRGQSANFAVVDASMTELARPSLYQSEHCIEQLKEEISRGGRSWKIVGPVCESSDVLVKESRIGRIKEHDLLLIHSAGAYGYVMASQYNARALPAEWWLPVNGAAERSRARREFV